MDIFWKIFLFFAAEFAYYSPAHWGRTAAVDSAKWEKGMRF